TSPYWTTPVIFSSAPSVRSRPAPPSSVAVSASAAETILDGSLASGASSRRAWPPTRSTSRSTPSGAILRTRSATPSPEGTKVAPSPARAEDQQRLAGCELDLMGEVVGGGAGDRDRRSVGEGDLLRLGHRLGGLEDRVLSEGAQAAGRGPEHLVPDGDVLDPLPHGGHDPGRFQAHRGRHGPARAEDAFPALPVGGVHAGGANLDGDLAGPRRGGLALRELLALRPAIDGEDEDCRHEGLLLEGWEQCGAQGRSAAARPDHGGSAGLIGAEVRRSGLRRLPAVSGHRPSRQDGCLPAHGVASTAWR